VIGTSRKSFLGRITGRDVTERVHATVATCVLALERGATVFRVHDVAAVSDALKVTSATVAGWPTSPRTTTTT
jgi:dihydropteroate synthase